MATPVTLKNVVNNAFSKLNVAIGAADLSLTVTTGDGSKFPAAPFLITIDSEIILVGAKTADTFSSLTRGSEGTTAASHTSQTLIENRWTALQVQDLQTIVSVLNLSVTAAGDIIIRNSGNTDWARLALGTGLLGVSGGLPAWLTTISSALTFSGVLTLSATSAFTNASPFSVANGQTLTVSVSAQTVGAATLTVPNFAGAADTFVFTTLAQTLSNKTFGAGWNFNGQTLTGNATLSGSITLGSGTTIADATLTNVTTLRRTTSGRVVDVQDVTNGQVDLIRLMLQPTVAAVNDEASLGFFLRNSAAADIEFGRVGFRGTNVTATTEGAAWVVSLVTAGVIADRIIYTASTATLAFQQASTISASGALTLSPSAGNILAFAPTTAGNVNFSYASTAVGTVAATLGNIRTGGVAAQTEWLQVQVNGNTRYIPIWS